jgi:hypothetical protein
MVRLTSLYVLKWCLVFRLVFTYAVVRAIKAKRTMFDQAE